MSPLRCVLISWKLACELAKADQPLPIPLHTKSSAPEGVRALKQSDPSTIQDKFLVQYVGCYACPGDGVPLRQGHHGWRNWFDHRSPDTKHPYVDLFPDVSSYSPSELYPVPWLTTNEQTFLFSSRNPITVQRHFHWMAEHGVDGAFLYRWAGWFGEGQNIWRSLNDEMIDHVLEAAEKEGRVFAIEYDVYKVSVSDVALADVLEQDWQNFVYEKGLLNSPNYLRENGKPVISLKHLGWHDASHTPTLVRSIVAMFRRITPGGAYIIAYLPTCWRTLKVDADPNSELLDVWLNEFDAICPNINAGNGEIMKVDVDFIRKRLEGGQRTIDYIPSVHPGESKNLLPQSDKCKFMALDEDGYDLPSDWYMRICGLAAEALHDKRKVSQTFPLKDLEGYWSTRTRIEFLEPRASLQPPSRAITTMECSAPVGVCTLKWSDPSTIQDKFLVINMWDGLYDVCCYEPGLNSVNRHFHWMAEHGVDGAFLYRWAGWLGEGQSSGRNLIDEVIDHVREAAEKEDRVFAIEYDVYKVSVSDVALADILEQDWKNLIYEKGMLNSPNYLRENGKPVISLAGLGLCDAGHTPTLVRSIVAMFQRITPGGAYIIAHLSASWRSLEGNADPNAELLDVWLNEFHAICPNISAANGKRMKADVDFIRKRLEGGQRTIDYIPSVYPGTSTHNWTEGKWKWNEYKRDGGRFLWDQIYNASKLGARTMYGVSWDDYCYGHALLPVVPQKNLLPQTNKCMFMALDEDGYDLPSDWYMRICGLAAEALHDKRKVSQMFPLKDLEDYWSTRTRVEFVAPELRASNMLTTLRTPKVLQVLRNHRKSGPSVVPQASETFSNDSHALHKILNDEPSYRRLLSARGQKAEMILDGMQKVLDYEDLSDVTRRSIVVAMLRLSKASATHPRCMTLQGIKIEPKGVAAGGFGEVFKGKHGKQSVCLKVAHVYQDSNVHQLTVAFLKEAILWSQLFHPNVLPFYGIYCPDGNQVALVSPWMEEGNICDYLKRNPAMPRLPLVLDILQGLSYLHRNSVVHSDLKGANVLVTLGGSACLADFGLSSIDDPAVLRWHSLCTATQAGGTVRWQAPELLGHEDTEQITRANSKSDVYSAASVMYEASEQFKIVSRNFFL
ncbi:Serine/threonine-protein kinase-transforming protein raf [Leucoagaricus sp. SymC.cos]|nr:Serine/threonine-protein kinase-transforming protein raf [Leucoagaricus sp. SymC.cos]